MFIGGKMRPIQFLLMGLLLTLCLSGVLLWGAESKKYDQVSSPGAALNIMGNSASDIRIPLNESVSSTSSLTDRIWSTLGSGLDGEVYALAVYDGKLIVGGAFKHAGGVAANYVASWDGSRWSTLGSGIPDRGFTDYVRALAVYNGKLVIAGSFFKTDVANTYNIAAWDGSTWSAIGSGTNNNVNALTVYDGKLIAGGGFQGAGGASASRIASWDGSNWSQLGSGVGAWVWSLSVLSGNLYAGGDFGIEAWNGSNWSAPGGGVSGGSVWATTVFNNELIVGGGFSSAGGSPASEIAAWNGSGWSSLRQGMNGGVTALTSTGDVLVAGGSFTQAGGGSANRIAIWNSTDWSPLGSGMDGKVTALVALNPNQLVAAGNFSVANGISAKRIVSIGRALTVKGAYGRAYVSWSRSIDPSFLRYRLYYGLSQGVYTIVDSSLNLLDTLRVVPSLTNGSTYYFLLTTVDSLLHERDSICGSGVPDLLAPTALSVLAQPKSVALSWKRNIEPNILRYRIYVGTVPQPDQLVDSVTNSTADNLTKTIVGLNNGLVYYFRIKAVDSSNNESPYSVDISATPDLLAPAHLWGSASNGKALLAWNSVGQSEFLRYRIYGGTTSPPTTLIDSTTGGVTDTNKAIPGLTNGMTYFFRVTTLDSTLRESAYSNQISLTPQGVGVISIDHVDGLKSGDTLSVGVPIRFVLRYSNNTSQKCDLSNAWKITSTDGAKWDSVSIDTLAGFNPGQANPYWQRFSIIVDLGEKSDGNSPDTIRLLAAGRAIKQFEQLPAGYSDTCVAVTVWFHDNSSAGKHIYIDSVHEVELSQGGTGLCWLWVGKNLVNYYPEFNGLPGQQYHMGTNTDRSDAGYCFTIYKPCADLDNDDVCDSVDNCPSVANHDQVDWNNDGVGDACTPTPPGSNIVVQPSENTTVTFATVTQPGTTGTDTASTGPTPPANFGVVPLGHPDYYQITTTATFQGQVQVCITYKNSDVVGSEMDLQLLHYNGSTWDDITADRDTLNNKICGYTSSFSPFALVQHCCLGRRGNVNLVGATDLSDLSALVSYLTGSGYKLLCSSSANVNGVGSVDLSDLSAMVAYLTGGGYVLPSCP
jgi:hypothetical protein